MKILKIYIAYIFKHTKLKWIFLRSIICNHNTVVVLLDDKHFQIFYEGKKELEMLQYKQNK